LPASRSRAARDPPWQQIACGAPCSGASGSSPAGGDGTICGVADVALKAGKTLGVLPLGTFNYFARNLGIPLDLEAAARTILEGGLVRAPVLDLDGRLVLNNASFGIHPAVLLKRRKLHQLWGRHQLNAYLSAMLTAFRRVPKVRVRLAMGEAG